MTELVTGAILLSLLHGLIPSHWLPLLTLKTRFGWSDGYTLKLALAAAFAHVLSTVLLGFLIGLASLSLAEQVEAFTKWVAPTLLIGMGLFFIWQHNRHHHFHLSDKEKLYSASPRRVIGLLLVMMFLSPCLEIEALFLSAGAHGWMGVVWVALIYAVGSMLGIVTWVAVAQHGIRKLNWHRIEHSSGLISGLVLIVIGIAAFFLH